MRLEQFNYVFSHKEKKEKPYSLESDGAFLCLNGNSSKIDVSKTFPSVQSNKGNIIRGYSCLEHLVKDKTLTEFSLKDNDGNEVIFITEIPWLGWSSEKIEDEEYTKLVSALTEDTKPVEVVIEPPAETEVQEKGARKQTIPGEKYKALKTKLEKSGYTIKEEGNICFLYKEDDVEDNVLILDAGDTVEILETTITEDGIITYEDDGEVLEISVNDGVVKFNHVEKK